MRKVTSYLFLTGSALFLLYACTKTGSSTTIVGNWINRFDFDGVGRTNGVSFVIGDIAYVTTGYGGQGNTDTSTAVSDRLFDTWKYNVDNNSWTKLANLPKSAARSNAAGFATSTKGYIVGGLASDGITRLKDTWEYDPTANTWTQRADFLGTARFDAVGFGINNLGYIATGFDGNYLKDFYSFTPPTTGNPNGVWAQLQSFQGSKRRGASVFVNGGKAYVMGGQDNTTYPSDFWVFDPAGGWTAKGAIANVLSDTKDDGYTGITRVNGTAFVMNSKGYLATGAAGSLYKTVWEYDFSTDTWAQKTDFEGGARTGALSFTVKNRGFLLTGTSSTLYYSDFWEFHPDEAYNQYD